MTQASLRWFTSSTQDFPFKRHKVPRACQHCRRKKIRCDGKTPCGRCVQQSLGCSYAEQKPAAGTKNANPSPPHVDTARRPHKSSPPSPSPSPSPKHPLQHDPHYVRAHLGRISFSNSLYDSMVQTDSGCTTRRMLPPLMYDFFHLTSQPHSIWTSFSKRFRHYIKQQQHHEHHHHAAATAARDLVKEALSIFERHHLLYSALCDLEAVRNTIGSQFLSHMAAVPDTVDAITLFAILALVFRAAFQALASTDMAARLEQCATALAAEAQQRFLHTTFLGERQPGHDTQLVAVAILLTHYLCGAVCRERAYMVLQVGIGYALRCSLGASSNHHPNACSDDDDNDNDNTKRIQEQRRRRRRLCIVLDAWQTWMSFYLRRDRTTAMTDDDQLTKMAASEKDWALHALVEYAGFLRRIASTNMECVEIKNEMEQLLPQIADVSTLKDTAPNHLPACTLALFHHVLAIQLFSCHCQDEASHPSESSIMLEVCESAAAKIVNIVDSMMMGYHAPMTDDDDNDNGAASSKQQHDPINTCVLYPLCLATTTISALYCLRRQCDDQASRRRPPPPSPPSSNDKPAIFKLRRVLNPLCAQIPAASAISAAVDEIQAAVRQCSQTPSLGNTNSHDTAAVAAATREDKSGRLERKQRSSPSTLEQGDSAAAAAAAAAAAVTTTTVVTTGFPGDGDSVFLPDDPFRSSTCRYYPARNEIDVQQLDKLDPRSNSTAALATYTHPSISNSGGAAGATDMYAPGLAAVANPISPKTRGQKKRRHGSAPNPLYTNKRSRLNSGSDDAMLCYDNAAAAVVAAAAAQQHTPVGGYVPRGRHSIPSTTFPMGEPLAQQPPVGFPVYADHNFLMMGIQPMSAAAAAATGVPSFGGGNHSNHHGQQQQQRQDQRTQTTTTTTRGSSSAPSEPLISSGILEDNDNIPRHLPLPKHQQQVAKNWTAISQQQLQRSRDEPFQASVIETLHPNTLGSSTTTTPSTMYPTSTAPHHHHQYMYSPSAHSAAAAAAAASHHHQHSNSETERGGAGDVVCYLFNMQSANNSWISAQPGEKSPSSSSSPSQLAAAAAVAAAASSSQQHHTTPFAVRQQPGMLQQPPAATAGHNAHWYMSPSAGIAAAATNVSKIMSVAPDDMLSASWHGG